MWVNEQAWVRGPWRVLDGWMRVCVVSSSPCATQEVGVGLDRLKLGCECKL